MFAVRPRYRTCTDALAALHLLLAEQDVHDLHITLPPAIWHREPDDTMRFAMLEAGFVSTGRDVHSVVPLGSFTGFGSGSRVGRSVRRADTDGVSIQRDAPLTAFATVLDATFRKHGTTPTHTPAELAWLVEHLPTQVRVHVAWMAGHPVAGIAEFLVAPHVRQAFYLAQDPAYQQHQALSRLIVDALTHARDDGFAYYDFGTSSVEQQARTGVLEFKETFGATLHSRERLIWRRDARPRG
jgi:GNAT superfamily N-acetyltransferase